MTKTRTLTPFKVGATVQWNWMGHIVKGSVKKIYLKPVSKVFRGTVFKRNGSPEKPAYFIRSEAGSDVVKSHTELTVASKTRRSLS